MRLSLRRPSGWPLGVLTLVLAAGALALLVGLATNAFADWTAWIVATQRELHGGLAAALERVRTGGWAAAWPLVALSFGYGVFHAAGPGHGKVVVSTYLASHESRLGQALALSTLAALAQAVTAIVAVHVAFTVLGYGLRQARSSVEGLDAVSFALIAGLGLVLSLRATLALVHRLRGAPAAGCDGHGHHVHHHEPRANGGRWAASRPRG